MLKKLAQNSILDTKAQLSCVVYPNIPIRYSRPLETFLLPNKEKIIEAAKLLFKS